jgi:hypothetical protein
MVAAAVEATVGTLHHLKLGFARHTSPALWVAVGTAVNLQSLHLFAKSDDPYKDWADLKPWDLPYLRRLGLELDLCCRPGALDAIFTFLGRCSFPDLLKLEISPVDLESSGREPAVERFLGSHPKITNQLRRSGEILWA